MCPRIAEVHRRDGNKSVIDVIFYYDMSICDISGMNWCDGQVDLKNDQKWNTLFDMKQIYI